MIIRKVLVSTFLNRISHVLTADQSPDLHLQKEGKLNNLLPNLNCMLTACFADFELFGELVLYMYIYFYVSY